MKNDKDFLFALSPREFERLCVRLLTAEGYQDVFLRDGSEDQPVDIIAEHEGEQVAVEVIHRRRPLERKDVLVVLERIRLSPYTPGEVVIITSSPVTSSLRAEVQHTDNHLRIRIMGQEDILQALSRHSSIQLAALAPVSKRVRRQHWALGLGLSAVAASILGAGANVLPLLLLGSEKPALHQQIEGVERAIGSLRDLEGHLTDIKQDMVRTELAAKVIHAEYAKAKELEKLTDEQFTAIKTALARQSWGKTVLDYFLGFVLGVGASLTASAISSRLRQERALNRE